MRPIIAASAALRSKPTNYPEPFASRMAGREKRPLGDLFGLSNFGVNLTTLKPGAASAPSFYPDDDIQAVLGAHGKWEFRRKDGSPY